MLGLIGLIIATEYSKQQKITMQDGHLCWTPTFSLDPQCPPHLFNSRTAVAPDAPLCPRFGMIAFVQG